MLNIWIEGGDDDSDCQEVPGWRGQRIREGQTAAFHGRHHSGHPVHFQEATMYLCDTDETGGVVYNQNGEISLRSPIRYVEAGGKLPLVLIGGMQD